MPEVIIRLKRLGTKKKPHHRIVVMDRTKSTDSRTIEELGYYTPTTNPPTVKINLDRADYWVSKGAMLSPTVKQLIKKHRKSAA